MMKAALFSALTFRLFILLYFTTVKVRVVVL